MPLSSRFPLLLAILLCGTLPAQNPPPITLAINNFPAGVQYARTSPYTLSYNAHGDTIKQQGDFNLYYHFDRKGTLLAGTTAFPGSGWIDIPLDTYDNEGHWLRSRYYNMKDDKDPLPVRLEKLLAQGQPPDSMLDVFAYQSLMKCGRSRKNYVSETRYHYNTEGQLRCDSVFRNDSLVAYELFQYTGKTKAVKLVYDGKGILEREAITQYDAKGRKVQEQILDEKGKERYKTIYTYDIHGRLASRMDYGSSLDEEDRYVYNKDGSLAETQARVPGQPWTKTLFTYDVSGRKIREEHLDASGKLTGKTVYEFDDAHNRMLTWLYLGDPRPYSLSESVLVFYPK